MIFNFFINQLLENLSLMQPWVWIGSKHINSFAYVDDITLLSGTIPGLQRLIDKCAQYASKWSFRFGVNNTKCMAVDKHEQREQLKWFLNNDPIDTVQHMDVLGIRFQANLSATSHVDDRIIKCRRAFFGLGEIGMSNPRVSPEVKSHLWRSICSPTLSYGLECIDLTSKDSKRLESLQGTLIKGCVGIGKRSHSSSLLSAMRVPSVGEIRKQKTVTLLHDICRVPGPANDLCMELLKQYIVTAKSVPGTLINRVLKYDESPVHALLNKIKVVKTFKEDGIIDSIKYMLCHINFIKPYSIEQDIIRLLTRVF